LGLARLFLACASGFFNLQVVGVDKGTVATHHRHLAHLGHRAQATGELANHLVLVGAQLGNVDGRLAKAHAQVSEVLHLVHDRRHMQQRLAGNAAHVEAHASQGRVALDDHHLEPQVGRAEGRRVAAGPAPSTSKSHSRSTAPP
jgi:hypothetical protein